MGDDYYKSFSSVGEKYVCNNCFDDYALEQFIKEQGEPGTCSYCNNQSDYIVHIDEILAVILEGIETEWTQPGNVAGWNGREGGWQCKVFSTDELFEEIGLECSSRLLFLDIINSLTEDEWCKNDPYALDENKEVRYTWKEFCSQITHKTRYVFYKIKQEHYYDSTEMFHEPYEVLDYIADTIKDLNLVTTLPVSTTFYRARLHSEDKSYNKALDLGPPPPGRAVSNRMSPAGIPMFYGAFDKDTARAEIEDGKKPSDTHITFGEFKLQESIKVVDFTKAIAIPSIFDPESRHLRQQILFLRPFIRDLTKAIEKDGREHIDYVPTQVVTEFLRHVFHDGKDSIQGLLYRSSKNTKGICCVLFFDQTKVSDTSASSTLRESALELIIAERCSL